MEGLAPCHNLRAVTLRCSWPKPVTPAAIEKLALSWPKLEELTFSAIWLSPGVSRTPITILEDLALAWSETLGVVSLILDERGQLPSASAVRGRFKKSDTIWVGDSFLPKDRVLPVAEFIASMCTTTPRIFAPGSEDFEGNWEAVEQRVAKILHSRQTSQ
ncbi:hypothetical protein M407DRAFT_241735 [Tulasnella calospora MUT 4182]|uniref:Uncharacterized protein n=1 Tax=Tulasnella calospora MUT 4182 TaxID=1051891 RepID=A0A0C3QS11_9AGAM|nr:hypothetical protein M407DRAFT_241735 [Tulasnella calospora MUT 4182]